MKKIYLFIAALIASNTFYGQYFTEVTPSPFEDMFDGNSVFTDVDNDGDLDIFIVGLASTEDVVLYRNDGNGNYIEDTGNSFEGVRLADVAVADVNGNGYMDLLISGRNTSRSEEHTSELQSRPHLVCRLLLEKKKKKKIKINNE